VTNTYALWHSLVGTQGSPPAESEISAGFWRLPSSRGHARPVSTWYEDSAWQVLRVGVDAFDSNETTKWLAFKADAWPMLQAMSEASYEAAVANEMWPDNVPARPAYGWRKPKEPIIEPEIANPSLSGHNKPPEDTKLNELIDALDQLVAEASKLAQKGEAKTQADADVASNLKARIRDLRQRIVATHDAEKAPVLAEGKRIDQAYFQYRDKADALERRLHAVVIRPFLLEQQRLADEARAKAKAGGPMPEVVPVSAGAKGRKTSLRTHYIGTIADYDKFYEAVKGHDAVKSFMTEYAQSIAANLHKIGASVDGLTITEEKI
jgi:hypothetical protein